MLGPARLAKGGGDTAALMVNSKVWEFCKLEVTCGSAVKPKVIGDNLVVERIQAIDIIGSGRDNTRWVVIPH